MASAGALLGSLSDALCHGRYEVLHYTPADLSFFGLSSARWVPPLFALAGVIIGTGLPLLDRWLFKTPAAQRTRSAVVGNVLLGIVWFAAVYLVSGVLSYYGVDSAVEAALLTPLAALSWAVFEATPAGLVMSFATAAGGPLIEVGLVNWTDLYAYSRPDVLGVPVWLPLVYFCGGPAVGNLGRAVAQKLGLMDGS
ncbi:unnamed protein product [Vitrella brassicaformis CCMP3155]|uniref:Uncharacterized protein n=2 Tax=Vitrella brassicaformis TaxID=1169539 RepID=A0A0G4EKP3_VITBC|nr:unnamed protein product [Vitrella brassicaformis CCMP3155]|eukprot:CEL98020.1 unnamed protein product [Vitrella brassicaformis CCMP3155]